MNINKNLIAQPVEYNYQTNKIELCANNQLEKDYLSKIIDCSGISESGIVIGDNTANFNEKLTDVGTNGGASAYGAYDFIGQTEEWLDHKLTDAVECERLYVSTNRLYGSDKFINRNANKYKNYIQNGLRLVTKNPDIKIYNKNSEVKNIITDVPESGNQANYGGFADWGQEVGINITDVGTNGRGSFYGTFDQNGLVWEWTDQITDKKTKESINNKEFYTLDSTILRGGSWYDIGSGMKRDSIYSRFTVEGILTQANVGLRPCKNTGVYDEDCYVIVSGSEGNDYNTSNYNNSAIWLNEGLRSNLTTVGTNGKSSAYNTYDQDGLVWEIVLSESPNTIAKLRGGDYNSTSGSIGNDAIIPYSEQEILLNNNIGLRLASSTVRIKEYSAFELVSKFDINPDINLECGSNIKNINYDFYIQKYVLTNQEYVNFLNTYDASGTRSSLYFNSNMSLPPNGGLDYISNNPVGSKYVCKKFMNQKPVVGLTIKNMARLANALHNTYTDDPYFFGALPSTENGVYDLSTNDILNTSKNTINYKTNFVLGTGIDENKTEIKKYLLDVGSAGTPSSFGTYDQNGGLLEWCFGELNTNNMANNIINGSNQSVAYFLGTDFNLANQNACLLGTAFDQKNINKASGTFTQFYNKWQDNSQITAAGSGYLDFLKQKRYNSGFRLASKTYQQIQDYNPPMPYRPENFIEKWHVNEFIDVIGANENDTSVNGFAGASGYLKFWSPGFVDYDYSIMKNKVTNKQYTEFLNQIDPNGWNHENIYDTRMLISFNSKESFGKKYSVSSEDANKPVNYISYIDAAKFANWMNILFNGQTEVSFNNNIGCEGSGTDRLFYEGGAYDFGTLGPCFGTTNIERILQASGLLKQNKTSVGYDVNYWIPSVDEWYKAAYYNPSSDSYYNYSTQSNSVPSKIIEKLVWIPSESEWFKSAYYYPQSGIYYKYATQSDTLPSGISHIDDEGNGPIKRYYLNTSGNLQLSGNTEDIDLVPYNYYISRYPITNQQYVNFLNSVDPEGDNLYNVYHIDMQLSKTIMFEKTNSFGNKYFVYSANLNNKPCVNIDWYKAARYCNWKHNLIKNDHIIDETYSIPITEYGAYSILGTNNNDSIDCGTENITQNNGNINNFTKWTIQTVSGIENITEPSGFIGEWDNNTNYFIDDIVSFSGHYWKAKLDYLDSCAFGVVPANWYCCPDNSTASNNESCSENSYSSFDPISFSDGWKLITKDIKVASPTTVGTNGSSSYYGTYDQDGNVSELVDISDYSNVDYSIEAFGENWNGSSARRNKINDYDDKTGFRLCSYRNPYNFSEFVSVKDITNKADNTSLGKVNYVYQIMKYEFTNDEYVSFLNEVDPSGLSLQSSDISISGIYKTDMKESVRGGIVFESGNPIGSKYETKIDMDNKPINFVTWLDAARVCNWLHNKEYNKSTVSGVYNLNYFSTGDYTSLEGYVKNSKAQYWIPTPNEWYKAAYYDPTKNNNTGGYWENATRSNKEMLPVMFNDTGDGKLSILKNTECLYWIPTEEEWYKAAYFDPNLEKIAGRFWNYATQSNDEPSPLLANEVFNNGIGNYNFLGCEQYKPIIYEDIKQCGNKADTSNDLGIINFSCFVHVGDAGNKPDESGFGGVDYSYWIQKYPLTNYEYAQFLNDVDSLGIYADVFIGDINKSEYGDLKSPIKYYTNFGYIIDKGMENKPAIGISLSIGAQICNWLNNKITNINTINNTSGSYVINISGIFKNRDAIVTIPTADEWYKAAYFKRPKTISNNFITNIRNINSAGYWKYPTQSDDYPSNIK